MHEGVQLQGAFPVVVTFTAYKDKEQIWLKAKEKLKKKNIFVTDDHKARMTDNNCIPHRRVLQQSKSTAVELPSSPVKKSIPKNIRSGSNSPLKKASKLKNLAKVKKFSKSHELSARELEDFFDLS